MKGEEPSVLFPIADTNRGADTTTFQHTALSFLAALVLSDNRLLVGEYVIYCTAVEKFLGALGIESSSARVSALDALHQSCPLQDAVDNLLKAAIRERASVDHLTDLVGTAIDILNENRCDDVAVLHQIIRLIETTEISKTAALQQIGALLDEAAISLPPDGHTWTTALSRKVSDIWAQIIAKGAGQRPSQFSLGPNDSALATESHDLSRRVSILARKIGSTALLDASTQFVEQVDKEKRPFRFVLVGEMKHGKSSLFNLLAGEQLSPTGEATATTATVIELRYSERPNYGGKWLSPEALERVRACVRQSPSNKHISDYGRLVESIISSPSVKLGGNISHIATLSAFQEQATTRGNFSAGIERLSAGLPVGALANGAVLVDTPGINDPMRVRDEISLHEASQADCVVFVLRADKFGSASEREFLTGLLRRGLFSSLIFVMTHVDRLSDINAKSRVFQELKTWIGESFQAAGRSITPGFVRYFAFDARESEIGSQTTNEMGLSGFLTAISTIASDPHNRARFRGALSSARTILVEQASSEIEKYKSSILASLPADGEIIAMEEAARKYKGLSDEYIDLAKSRLISVSNRLKTDEDRFIRSLSQLRSSIVNAIRAAVERHVRELGDRYAEDAKWKQFDQTTASNIVQAEMEKFHGEYRAASTEWRNELQLFEREMTAMMESCLLNLSAVRRQFVDVCRINPLFEKLMCNVDDFVSASETIAITATIGAGFGASLLLAAGHGPFVAGALKSAIGYLAFLPTGGVGIAIGTVAIAYTAHKLLTNPEKRKEAFIEKKIEKLSTTIDCYIKELEININNDFDELSNTFRELSIKRLGPLIQEIHANYREAHLKAITAQRVKNDTETFLASLDAAADYQLVDASR